MTLRGQIIFLTGGSEGIGRQCAQAYAAEGAVVAIAARTAERVEAAVAELGPQHLGVVCDVSQADQVEAAIAKTLEKYGRLNAIHNNAGIVGPSKPLHETSEAEWDELLAVNLKSVYLTTKYGFDALRESRGSILNTSSLVGVIGQAAHAAYTATKGGMNTLTKSMALDYAQYGIRVNAVCPAGTWTPMLRQWADDPAGSDGCFRLPRRNSSTRQMSGSRRRCRCVRLSALRKGSIHHRTHYACLRRC